MRNKKFRFLFLATLLLSLLNFSCSRDSTEESLSTDDTDENETVNEIGNVVDHDAASDYIWSDSDIVTITLNGTSISANGSGVTINGSKATITSAGTYSINGTLSDGQIIVESTDNTIVRLILNGASITCSNSAPIYISNAEKTMIVLADNTTNTISDGTTYTTSDGSNAAIYSTDDLTLYGTGSLTVNGNYADGITSKDGLIISSGTIKVNAVDDGIVGKDYLVIKTGEITVNADGDGIKSDNEDDTAKGYISVENGILNIAAHGDAITAETDVIISKGTFNLESGSGTSSSTLSQKGIKAGVDIDIEDGNFVILAADDAIHTNNDIEINNGTFSISSGDDGIHAEYNIVINSGTLNITKSYEGIESALGSLTLNGGNIYITASDDGINISAGGAASGGGPGQKSTTVSSTCALNITGGYLVINNEGDGLDSNNAMNISGGTMIVNSAEYNENSSIDCDGICKVNGGKLIGIGVSQMAQAPGTSSSQYSILINFKTRIAKGNLIHIEDSDGKEILTCTAIKSFNSLVFSSADLKSGSTYKLYIGGSSAGSAIDGIYTNETYTAGTLYSSFTISSIVTTKTI